MGNDLNSFKHNFNDDVNLEVKRSELNEGQFLVSVTTREFYVSGPELEALGYNIWEILKGDGNGPDSEDRKPSVSKGDDEESIEALLSDEDTRRS